MSVSHFVATPPVLRHVQDSVTTHCGRACAQMIISALTLDPQPGQNPPLTITQHELFMRERDHAPETTPGQWFTHPDELHELLARSPELAAAGLDNWRLARYRPDPALRDARRLVADIVLTLVEHDKPAAITWFDNDHWVLIVGAHLSPDGLVLEALDPLDPNPTGTPHQHRDACNDELNGRMFVLAEKVNSDAVISRDLRIDFRDNPADMIDYTDSCVGILFGPEHSLEQLDAFADEILGRGQRRRVLRGPSRDRLAEIRRVADTWEIPALHEFLERGSGLIADRTVNNVESNRHEFDIASLQADAATDEPRPGMVAVFAPQTGELNQFRFTTDQRATASLRQNGEEPLLWAPHIPDTLGSEYYPLGRDQKTQQLIRLVDGKEIKLSP